MSRSLALSSRSRLPEAARPALFGLLAWFSVALVVALSGVLTIERRFAIPVTLLGLVVTQVVLFRRGRAWRALADAIDDRALVLFHVVRAPIGIAFLLQMAHGLDATFARLAGIGDLVSGVLALVVGIAFPRSRALVLAWNVLGLVDILAVVLTAQRILIFSDHPQTMAMLIRFPWMLLPTFLVPIVITTHVLLLSRLRRGARSESA